MEEPDTLPAQLMYVVILHVLQRFSLRKARIPNLLKLRIGIDQNNDLLPELCRDVWSMRPPTGGSCDATLDLTADFDAVPTAIDYCENASGNGASCLRPSVEYVTTVCNVI